MLSFIEKRHWVLKLLTFVSSNFWGRKEGELPPYRHSSLWMMCFLLIFHCICICTWNLISIDLLKLIYNYHVTLSLGVFCGSCLAIGKSGFCRNESPSPQEIKSRTAARRNLIFSASTILSTVWKVLISSQARGKFQEEALADFSVFLHLLPLYVRRSDRIGEMKKTWGFRIKFGTFFKTLRVILNLLIRPFHSSDFECSRHNCMLKFSNFPLTTQEAQNLYNV